jgi:hypothetical protein
MPETRTYIVYKFEELSAKAQENAITLLREQEYESFPSERLEESFVGYLKEWGYPSDDIRFSLSYCQGDGVAFYGRISDWDILLPRICPDKPGLSQIIEEWDVSISIAGKSNHYHHHKSMMVVMEYDQGNDYPVPIEVVEALNKLTRCIEEDVCDRSKELERLGYLDIEHSMKEEVIKEAIEANQWRFLEDGRLDY